MKDEITTSVSYTLKGGENTVEELDRLIHQDTPILTRAYVILRRLLEKMKIDLIIHRSNIKREEERNRPKPPTIREERNL